METSKEAPHPFLVLVGRNIKKYRIERKLSHAKLGAEVGLGKGHIFRMEQGHNMTLISILRIAIALQVPPEKLVTTGYPLNKEELTELMGY